MTHSPADQDPYSVPQGPRRSETSRHSSGPVEVPRRPLGAAEVRTSPWGEVASLDSVAPLTPADPATEDTPPTAFPGSYDFDMITPREDSTTDATPFPNEELDAKLHAELRRMSAQHIITLNDEDDGPADAAKPIIESVRPPVKHETPDFRALARTPDLDFDEDDARSVESPLTWVLVGALVASTSVLLAGWLAGLV